jgi:hypothetical protein
MLMIISIYIINLISNNKFLEQLSMDTGKDLSLRNCQFLKLGKSHSFLINPIPRQSSDERFRTKLIAENSTVEFVSKTDEQEQDEILPEYILSGPYSFIETNIDGYSIITNLKGNKGLWNNLSNGKFITLFDLIKIDNLSDIIDELRYNEREGASFLNLLMEEGKKYSETSKKVILINDDKYPSWKCRCFIVT